MTLLDRRRSFWAWGYEDALPDEAATSKLAAQIEAFFGETHSRSRGAPPLRSQLALAAPRVSLPADLSGSNADEDRITHTHGRGYADLVRGFLGDFRGAPDGVFFPRAEKDIESIFAWAASEQVTLVPYGGGTSVVSGVAAEVGPGKRGVATVDLCHLNQVLEVDSVSRAARIQAGAKGPELEAGLAPHGFTLRHFPQSFEFSTLGGWIATRAGGHYATLFTHIDDLVESVRMLTPAGVFETRRLPASGAGPDPNRWVLGSEGTLGIITEAWMRVVPKPTRRASASVRFTRFEDAVRAARMVAQSGLYPTNCRLLDSREAWLHHVVDDGSNVLLLGFESADHELGPWIDRAVALAVAEGGSCPTGVTQEARDAATWKQAFFDAPYLQSALVTLGVVVDTFETACTWDRFEALHANVVRRVESAMNEACGKGILTCRFTHVYPDGPAPYYTFLAPGRANEQIDQWRHIKDAACQALDESGATITHHHAVGRLHRPGYEKERPVPFEQALRATKAALDPDGLLNTGVLIAP
jgi:alkyldihydroxyacetonephosphate synthase